MLFQLIAAAHKSIWKDAVLIMKYRLPTVGGNAVLQWGRLAAASIVRRLRFPITWPELLGSDVLIVHSHEMLGALVNEKGFSEGLSPNSLFVQSRNA